MQHVLLRIDETQGSRGAVVKAFFDHVLYLLVRPVHGRVEVVVMCLNTTWHIYFKQLCQAIVEDWLSSNLRRMETITSATVKQQPS